MEAFGALLRETMVLCAVLALPVLLIAACVGTAIALVQAATQVQEQTLTMLPKCSPSASSSRSSEEPLILDAELEATIAPERALALRDEIVAYLAHVPRERAAVLCGTAFRPVLSDVFLRSGIRVEVLSYAELPPEIPLRPFSGLPRAPSRA